MSIQKRAIYNLIVHSAHVTNVCKKSIEGGGWKAQDEGEGENYKIIHLIILITCINILSLFYDGPVEM